MGAEDAEVLGRIDLLAWRRVEEAAFAFDGELPIDDSADDKVAALLEDDVAVAPQQGTFAEDAAPIEQDDEALQFVVGGRSCLDRRVEVGIGGEEQLLPAGEVNIEEVELKRSSWCWRPMKMPPRS